MKTTMASRFQAALLSVALGFSGGYALMHTQAAYADPAELTQPESNPTDFAYTASESPEDIFSSADTTLQSWQSEKTQSMANKPYLGALKPSGDYGTFGEGFISADTSDSTDAKMGLITFDLGKYDKVPTSSKMKLTYIGYRGNPSDTATDSINVMAVSTSSCTNNAASCPPASATWATRPDFSSKDAVIAESQKVTLKSGVYYTNDSLTIDPAKTTALEIDVTDIVKAQFAAGNKTITFAVQESEGAEMRFISSEGAVTFKGATSEMAPQLVVTPQVAPYMISVTKKPKLRYKLGEDFDPSGIVVTKKDTATNTTSVLSADQYTIDSSAFSKDDVGSYPIIIALVSDPTVTAQITATVAGTLGTADDGDISSDDVMWYEQPASQTSNGNVASGGTISGDNDTWQRHTLPIGNGKVGGTVWGEIGRERITFNEETLWTGGPGTTSTYNGGNNGAKGSDGATLRALNKQLEAGAQTVNPSSLTGGENAKEQGSYQNWGNIYIDYGFSANSGVKDFKRSLNLSRAKADVSFTRDNVTYTREFFVSNPDNVMVARLSASEAEALNLNITFPSNAGFSKTGETTTVSGDTLTVKGALANNGLLYDAKIKAVLDDGVGSVGAGTRGALTISGATGVTLYIAAATNYKQEYPNYRNGEDAGGLDARVAGYVQSAANKGYAAVKNAHIADHSKLYKRVAIDLGQDSTVGEKALATDALLNAYKAGTASTAQKRTLEMLVYQYGRYLTISSSRENSQLPSNLQGIWSSTADDNAHGATPWGSDFHMNVNLQMNYWPTYSANLGELAKPLIDYAKGLVEPGRVTAKTYAGASTDTGTPIGEGAGYMAHTENTAYGWTAPGHTFSWGWSPAAMPWLLQNVYEAYEFSGDKALLKDTIYPLLKEEANFYVNYMLHKGGQKATDGSYRLTTGVAYSPEHGPLGTDGNTYESSLVWQLLNDSIEAAKALGADANLVSNSGTCSVDNWAKDDQGVFTHINANRSWSCALSLLKPIEVGNSGQIKEWYFEGDLGKKTDGSPIGSYQKNHRHLSHMLGLFPGDLITADNSQYMDAAKVSLRNRGDDATGWGVGQRINAWARTGDGNHAYQLVEKQLKNAMYPNLFDAHPPFQIDGNFGNTSGINEMLLQSNATYTKGDTQYANYMSLLPALPDAWSTEGSAQGLVARGNFVVDMKWKDGAISDLSVTSVIGKQATLKFAGAGDAVFLDKTANKLVSVSTLDADHVTFPTEAGHTYVLTKIQEVTPHVPTLSTPKCAEKPEVMLPELIEGVEEYAQTIEGDEVTVTAVLKAGYKLAPNAQGVWRFNIAPTPCPELPDSSEDTPNNPQDNPADSANPQQPSGGSSSGAQELKPVSPADRPQLSSSGATIASVIFGSFFLLGSGLACYASASRIRRGRGARCR